MNDQSHLWREDLGAYLVGSLEADETERMRRHLNECAACRAEYEQLAPVVGLLAAVPAEALTADAGPSAPPDPEGWERLRARAGLAGPAAPAWRARPGTALGGANGVARPPNRTAPRRARRPLRPLRPTAAAALSGALVAAVAFGLYAGLHHDNGPGVVAGTETISAVNNADGVSGTVQYRPADWGSWVQITLKGVKPGDACVLYAMDGAGHKAVASTWWAPPVLGESATIPGGVSMQAWNIKTFQVTTSVGGDVLLTIPAS